MSIIRDYFTHGWSIVAIPPGGKKPHHPGWQTRQGALQSADALPAGFGLGLCHAYSGTMALDVDDWDRTLARGIDVNALAGASDSVMIQSGVPGHGKLLYKMPFGLRLPSKKITEEIGRDERNHVIKVSVVDFRCGTLDDLTVQDVLPPSVHPVTQQPYQWAGNGHWSRLPMIPAELLDYWRALLKDVRPATINGVNASWDEIRSALIHISPDCHRDEWVHVGMALKLAGEQTFNPDEAFKIWDDWSARGEKYKGQRETYTQWRSFRSEKNQIVTLGTLYHLASQYGWIRPTQDASTLFADVSAMVPPGDVLATMKAAPPEIDLSLWPTVLARRAQEVSDTIGCDPIVPLWAGLGAACGAVDARSRLDLMPGFQVPPVLWLMTVGDPGDKKSPGSKPMLAPLNIIKEEDRSRYAKDFSLWQYNQKIYATAHEALMKYAASPEGLLDPSQAPIVPIAPREPVPLRFTVDDITSQELLNKCQFRPRGMLASFDEMNSWAAKITNRQSGENRSSWVKGFECDQYELDRVKNGETFIEHFALSIFGNMQPKVLTDNFTNLASDGLLQRFIPAIPRHNQTRMGNPIPEFLSSSKSWENALRLTYALPIRTYHLTSDAYQVFRSFQEWHIDRTHTERLMRSSNEFVMAFGKITGLAGRIALMFHILEDPWKPTVSGDLMRRVVRIMREYVVPAQRYILDGDGSSSAFDSWVMDHILQHSDLEKITMSEIARSARRPFERANITNVWHKNEWVCNAMHLLQEMRWVHRVDDGSKEQRGHAEWLINPHLRTTFKTHRDAVVKAKKERNEDRIIKSGSYQGSYTHGEESLIP